MHAEGAQGVEGEVIQFLDWLLLVSVIYHCPWMLAPVATHKAQGLEGKGERKFMIEDVSPILVWRFAFIQNPWHSLLEVGSPLSLRDMRQTLRECGK